MTGQSIPTEEDRILASRPSVFGPAPTAEEFARARVEGERLAQQLRQRLPDLKRLPPSAFPDLPAPLAQELVKRGCLIPQAVDFSPDRRQQANNVIHGELAQAGQQDWALFCSLHDPQQSDPERAYSTHLLVFWNGSPERPAELESFADGDAISMDWDRAEGDSPRNLFLNRALGVATQAFILEHDRLYGQR